MNDEFLSSWIPNIIYNFVSNPFNRLKIIKQNSEFKYIDIVKKIHKNQGYIGFFKGNLVNQVYIFLYNFSRFGLYNDHILIFYLKMQAFLYPFEKSRVLSWYDFKNKDLRNLSTIKYISNMLKYDGFFRIYKGIMLDSFIKIPEFYLIKLIIDGKYLNEFSYFSVLSAKLALYPLNTILRRYQLDSYLFKENLEYNNYKELFKSIRYKSLYNGIMVYGLSQSLIIPIQFYFINFFYLNFYGNFKY